MASSGSSDGLEVHTHAVHTGGRPRRSRAGPRRAEIAARRKQVAAFYLQHATEVEIAEMLGVDQATISRDLHAILAEWRQAYLVDAEAYVVRDLVDLDALERECATRLRSTGEAIWVLRLVQLKTRRAALLGLDAPSKVDLAVYVRERAAEMGMNPDEAVQRVGQHLRLVS